MKNGDPVYVKLNHATTYTILEIGGRVNNAVAWCEDNTTHERVAIPLADLELVPPPVAKLPRGKVPVYYDPETGAIEPMHPGSSMLVLDLRKHFIHEAAIKEIEKGGLEYNIGSQRWYTTDRLKRDWQPADSLEAAVLALDPKLGEALE